MSTIPITFCFFFLLAQLSFSSDSYAPINVKPHPGIPILLLTFTSYQTPGAFDGGEPKIILIIKSPLETHFEVRTWWSFDKFLSPSILEI